jgi:uncharacterized membrane protein
MNRNQLLAALALSLTVNLVIAGVFIGRVSRPGPPAEPPMAWAAEELSPQLRSEIRQRMRDRLPRVQPLRGEMRDAMETVRRLAEAEAFDAPAMRQALARLREAESAYQIFMHEEVLGLAASMSPEARRALLRRALHRPPRAPGPRSPHSAQQPAEPPEAGSKNEPAAALPPG